MTNSSRDRFIDLLKRTGPVSLSEIAAEGVTGALVLRMVREGIVRRLGRGLYGLTAGSTEAPPQD
jgi:hypothetical protein